ncbi:MAG: hypothetical protein INR62_08670 [Rhodospirillales bacterium]|nr:hypothetical protein [Acetobacter sp.]
MTGRRNNNRNNRGRPQQQGNMHGASDGPRYVPPQMRYGADIIRPESSMSNVSAQTFASQIPFETNYSYGPSNLTNNMSAYNPFAARHPHPFMAAGQVRPGFPPQSVVSDAISGLPPPPSSCGLPIRGRINGQPVDLNTPHIAQPMPVRRDSGAPPQSTAEYLASRIKNGDAESPYDPDYGNCGPTKKPPPPPEPIPYPTQKVAAQPSKVVAPKVGNSKGEDDTKGNSAAFLGSTVKIILPDWYLKAKAGLPPTIEQVFEDLPFIEAHRFAKQSTAGVVKITNVPYATSRTEVNGFLGRQTQLCHQPQGTGFYAVHLVMDRHTGKTMDAYVEVSTPIEAVWVVNQFQKRVMQKRPGKIGDRVVGVELSSQDELMATLFPRAKQVKWEGGVPQVDTSKQTYYAGVHSTGFNGFLQDEEIVHIKKHAETPQRVSISILAYSRIKANVHSLRSSSATRSARTSTSSARCTSTRGSRTSTFSSPSATPSTTRLSLPCAA